MDRKQFLGTLVALPIGIFLVHCSSSSTPTTSSTAGTSGTDPNAPGAPPTQSGGMDVYTSSTVLSHDHTFSLDDMSITTPPADGVTGDSSTIEAHLHSVMITSDQLAMVGMGSSVEVTSGSSGTPAHTHVFTFVKIA